MIRIINEGTSKYINLYDVYNDDNQMMSLIQDYSDWLGCDVKDVVSVTDDDAPSAYKKISSLVNKLEAVEEPDSMSSLYDVNGIKVIHRSDMGFPEFIIDQNNYRTLLGTKLSQVKSNFYEYPKCVKSNNYYLGKNDKAVDILMNLADEYGYTVKAYARGYNVYEYLHRNSPSFEDDDSKFRSFASEFVERVSKLIKQESGEVFSTSNNHRDVLFGRSTGMFGSLKYFKIYRSDNYGIGVDIVYQDYGKDLSAIYNLEFAVFKSIN